MFNTNKKYKLIGEANEQGLRRIKALRSFGSVRRGELGGWLQSEANLSHDGLCWVLGEAKVFGDAWVSDDAWVSGDAEVYGDAWVFDNAWVSGDATVSGDAKVFGAAKVLGDAKLSAPHHLVCISGFEHRITITPQNVVAGCQVLRHDALPKSLEEAKKLGLTKDNHYTFMKKQIKNAIKFLKENK